ncbi:MAG: glycosyltransferase family 2 protein [Acidobacteria bacterium]|nr:glycosyltransferase family 2 protein [Acidobacteriota bacterium]
MKVSVIFPTYNEKDSIREAIRDYFSTGLVDEIIVVNNNAAPGTSEAVAGTGAREVFEPRQGYGHALLRGIDSAAGDLLILSEPDGTLSGHDVLKLLAYSDDKPVVFGTRTSREFIWAGANMGWFLKWGNWTVAKMTELLFNTTILTDMGCTKRLLSREALDLIRPHLSVGGSHLGAQLLMEVVAHKIPFVEIPINYRSRVGRSSVTGSFWTAFWVGLRMIGMVLGYRFGLVRGPRTAWPNHRSAARVAAPTGERRA